MMNMLNLLAKGNVRNHSFALLALGCLFVSLQADAKRITINQAQQNAITFMGKNLKLKPSLSLTRSANPTDAYYIFNSTDGNGYVIVAGDDAVRPILGYSTSGTFNESHLPEGLQDLLNSYRKQIEALGSNAPAYVTTRAGEENTDSKQITTAQWAQDGVFSEFTPSNYPTGCVATASAIIMKYYGYPAKGTGSHSYVWNGKTLSANFEHDYEWDKMPMEYKKGENDDQFHGVARLMSDLGVGIEMKYEESGSSASSENAVSTLRDYFGYSKYISCQYWYNYTNDEWKQKVRQSIAQDHPVYYAAADASQGGHAFVIDGYKGDLFSVNWGWGGAYNGYFAIGQLAPMDDLNFNLQDNAIFDFYPSDGKEVICPLKLQKDLGSFYGINMNTTQVKKNEKVTFCIGNLGCNLSEGEFNGNMWVSLIDKNGTRKEDLVKMPIESFSPGYYYPTFYYWFTPKHTAEEGDSIVLYAQKTGSDEYIRVRGFDNSVIGIPAYGYKPLTAPFVTNVDEGAILKADNGNVLYNGEVLKGSTYTFEVLPDEDVQKSFVTVNDQLQTPESVTSKGIATYVIDPVYEDKYTVNVKAYKEYAEKDIELGVTPGTLEKLLADNNLDFLVYRNIKLKGQIDQRDFEVLSKKYFKKIDLSECTVAAYGNYQANAIPMEAFYGNQTLTHLDMSDGMSNIGASSFAFSPIQQVSIPASVTSINEYAFYACSDLTDVYMYHTTPISIDQSVFYLADNAAILNRTLHVPAGTKSAYQNSANSIWTQYFGKIVEDVNTGIQGVTINADDAVKNKTLKTSIYDLNGRRIQTPAKNHTYIQGGKKFIQR